MRARCQKLTGIFQRDTEALAAECRSSAERHLSMWAGLLSLIS
jgi:hypothetical protein